MKYSITLRMSGSFPGSPETDSINISKEEYNELWDRFIYNKAVREGWCGECPK